MGITVEWLDGSDLHENLVQEWGALIDRNPGTPIFLAPEWVTAWWKHFPAGTLRILCVRRDGSLAAIVPLVEDVERYLGIKSRVFRLAGEPQADRLGLAHDADDPDALFAAALALSNAAKEVDITRLVEISMGGEDEEAVLQAAREVGLTAAKRAWSRAPVLRLDKPLAEIEACYSKTLRTRLRRAKKKQDAAGGLSFRRWQPTEDEIHDLLKQFRVVEDLSWKGRDGVGIFSPHDRWEFILDVSKTLAHRGWLDVATLTQNTRLVAYRYGFRFGGVFLDYNLAHDPEVAHLSPGRTLLDLIVSDSHRIGLKAVDASRGGLRRPHLLADWTDESRWQSKVMLFGRSARGCAAAMAERIGKPIARRIIRRDIPGPRGSS